MSQENNELKRFLNSSKWFAKIFPSYKRFVSLVDFIDSLLRPEQKKFLEIKYKGETIDFKTQLLIYFEDRYDSEISEERKRESVKKFLDEYKFLFKTNIDTNQVRSIFLREIVLVVGEAQAIN